jgi:hypothetical protein
MKKRAPAKPNLGIFMTCAVFAALIFTVFSSGKVLAFSGGGTGTGSSPFQITTCAQLQDMQSDLAAHYKLMNDIDCSATTGWNAGAGFMPVGNDYNASFTGNLDGNNKTITGLFINASSRDYNGLFGYLSGGATVSNLALSNVNITGSSSTGALVGYAVAGGNATITNVSSSGTVTGVSYVGGLTGDFEGASMTKSHSTATVTGFSSVGGLSGYTYASGTCISSSYAAGNVIMTNSPYSDYGGGLVGENYCVVADSYATGNVNGGATNNYMGGLVGYTESNIIRSYSVGAVGGSTFVGGLVGDNSGGTITDSFWNTETSGQATSDGGTGKTTAEMKNLTTFQTATWDISSHATDLNNGYPYLSWQDGGDSPVWYIWDGTPSTPTPVNTSTSTFTDTVNGKQVTLEVDTSCNIQNAVSVAESSNATKDIGFDYPAGLVNFSADCGTPGHTTTVTLYFHGITDNNLVLRKYNPNTHAYTTVDAAVTQTAISGEAATKVTYQITDGGALDTDGQTNGIITDPVGLALAEDASIPTLATTGQNQIELLLLVGLLPIFSFSIVFLKSKFSKRLSGSSFDTSA